MVLLTYSNLLSYIPSGQNLLMIYLTEDFVCSTINLCLLFGEFIMNECNQTVLNLSFLLKNCSFFQQAEWYETISSTNDRLRELAQNGAPEGTVVMANEQTKGRGRVGRRFYSPKNCGLYFSFLLRPDENEQAPGLLTACGAVSVWLAVQKLLHVSLDIKWVNDLYYANKKLCGILAEGQFDQRGELTYVLLGIGINLAPPVEGYADEIAGKTISLAEIKPEANLDKTVLCAEIIRSFANLYYQLPNTAFLEIYRSQSCVLGTTVQFEQKGRLYRGEAIEIDDRARLVIRDAKGALTTLGTGEISLTE